MNNLTIDQIKEYLNEIFDLQNKMIDKDMKIIKLEFELAMEKSLVETYKKHYLLSSSVN